MDTVQIPFEFEYEYGMTYRDILHLPADHNLTADEIEAMKQTRFQNWVDFISAQSSSEE